MKKLILFSMLLALATEIKAQTIWYVEPGGTNSGTSWNDAGDLYAVVNQANDGDQIWVKKGTYHVNLIVKKSLSIYGGFNGTESSLSDRVLASVWDYSVLMPNHVDTISIINVNPDPRYPHPDTFLFPNRCHHMDSFRLDGFTLKGGSFTYINNHYYGGWGAAIRTDSVNRIILKNLWVDSNTAFLGGGIYIENSAHGWMENVLFTRNNAQNLGGGTFLSNCRDFKLINTAFTENIALCEFSSYPPAQISGGFYFEVGDYDVHNMTATNNVGEMAGTINLATVRFYNSIIYPDRINIFYNHDSTVYYNNCYLWTANPLQLQGWDPIPQMGDWNNVIWDYDIHNNVVTNNIFCVDPQYTWTPLILGVLYLPELSQGSPCQDGAGPFESLYPGGNTDVMLRNRFENPLDVGAFEYQQNNNRILRVRTTFEDDDCHIYIPLLSGDTTVYYITSDSTVSAGDGNLHYFLHNKNIHERNVVIPETVEYKGKTYRVTSLAGGAFRQDSITSVVLPKSVEEIAGFAFSQSTIENISPLYCQKMDRDVFRDCHYLKNVDMSRCTIDTLPPVTFHSNEALEWVKLPKTLVCSGDGLGQAMSSNFLYKLKSLKFVLLPSSMRDYYIFTESFYAGSSNYPTILLSQVPPYTWSHFGIRYRKVWFPCEYDSAYRASTWGTGFGYVESYHFLNLDSGYMDLDSVCPWEVERKYGFHPDTVGVYIVEKHNPNDCDSFNIYFVKSFLDPGEIYDTTINIDPNKEDTTVLWTWEGTGYAYNVYRDGNYITTVEQPYYLDTNIEFNVQYCYNFAPVNERYCEGRWSTTNCYTMLKDTTIVREFCTQQFSLHPNPTKEVLFVTAGKSFFGTKAVAFEIGSSSATDTSLSDSMFSKSEAVSSSSYRCFDNVTYEITDITGRIVLQGSYNASEGIRVSDLAKGVYLLRMEGKVGKFVKE